MAQTKGRRNRVTTYFEILTREGNPTEQAAALKALLTEDPSREYVSEAIEYIRDPDAVVGGKSSRVGELLDDIERGFLTRKIEHLQWQLDFREKHEQRYISPKLTELDQRNHYLARELDIARRKIRINEREPQDADALLAQLSAAELENTRLKANRLRKDRQVKEWRGEVEFLHEYIAVLKGDPATKTPDRQWPPPSWRPTEEADPNAAAVQELRAENERLQTENTYLKVERAKLTKDAESWRAKFFDRREADIEITRLEEEIERLTSENERESGDYDADIERLTVVIEGMETTSDIVWVVTYDNDRTNYFVFLNKADADSFYNDHNDAYPGASVQTEPATNFDFASCKLVDGELVRGGRKNPQPPKRVAGSPAASGPHGSAGSPPEHSQPIKPESVASPAAAPEPPKASHPSGEPATGRGRHFGCYPDPQSMERIRGLSARLKLDNTGLLRQLIDNELTDPPDVLPPRRKRANRIHHFGCYPDGPTWVKIRQLLDRYRIDNTELLSYLVERNQ